MILFFATIALLHSADAQCTAPVKSSSTTFYVGASAHTFARRNDTTVHAYLRSGTLVVLTVDESGERVWASMPFSSNGYNVSLAIAPRAFRNTDIITVIIGYSNRLYTYALPYGASNVPLGSFYSTIFITGVGSNVAIVKNGLAVTRDSLSLFAIVTDNNGVNYVALFDMYNPNFVVPRISGGDSGVTSGFPSRITPNILTTQQWLTGSGGRTLIMWNNYTKITNFTYAPTTNIWTFSLNEILLTTTGAIHQALYNYHTNQLIFTVTSSDETQAGLKTYAVNTLTDAPLVTNYPSTTKPLFFSEAQSRVFMGNGNRLVEYPFSMSTPVERIASEAVNFTELYIVKDTPEKIIFADVQELGFNTWEMNCSGGADVRPMEQNCSKWWDIWMTSDDIDSYVQLQTYSYAASDYDTQLTKWLTANFPGSKEAVVDYSLFCLQDVRTAEQSGTTGRFTVKKSDVQRGTVRIDWTVKISQAGGNNPQRAVFLAQLLTEQINSNDPAFFGEVTDRIVPGSAIKPMEVNKAKSITPTEITAFVFFSIIGFILFMGCLRQKQDGLSVAEKWHGIQQQIKHRTKFYGEISLAGFLNIPRQQVVDDLAEAGLTESRETIDVLQFWDTHASEIPREFITERNRREEAYTRWVQQGGRAGRS